MSILDRFRTLRELCRREYGDEFAEKYDSLNRGIPIGGIDETMTFVERVEAVKVKYGKRRRETCRIEKGDRDDRKQNGA